MAKKTIAGLLMVIHVILCSAQVKAQEVHIRIIETSDVHGAIFPFDFVRQESTKGSLSRVHTFVQQERNKPNQDVILVDNGDILQGDPSVYFYNSPDSSTNLCADVMNFMHYDLATVGNHDIEQGHRSYDKFNSELDFPWLGANVIDVNTQQPYFKPYHIIEKRGVKIAFLGLVTPAIPSWLHPSLYEGMYFEDMIVSAKHWLEVIQREEQADVIVGLFHAGIDPTYGGQSADSRFNENASGLVAKQVPGFDVVFVGHDHRGWNKNICNIAGDSVLILGTTSKALDVAVADLLLVKNTDIDTWRLSLSGELVSMKNTAPDPSFLKAFAKEQSLIQETVHEEIGYLQTDLLSREALFTNAAFVDLIHVVQLELTNADVSIASNTAFDETLHEGIISYSDMFKIYRYENLLYTMNLSGAEVDALLEYSYGKWFNQLNDEESHLLIFERDEHGAIVYGNNGRPMLKPRFYNFDSAAGINYTVDLSEEAGNRITIHEMTDGKPFAFTETYTVAINSYRGNGGGGHLTEAAGIPQNKLMRRVSWVSDHDMRFYISKWVRKRKIIHPVKLNNWNIIPAKLHKQAMDRDYLLLFGE